MELREIEFAIESILFASGEPISIEKLTNVFESDANTISSIINTLADQYDFEKRGLKIVRLENSVQMCTRSDYHEYVQKALESKRQPTLSQAALEVLAIIAYNQPVTKLKIESIRGVDSSNTVSKLVERGLVEEKGRLNAPGKPLLFGTTKDFLRCFGICSLNELPDIEGIFMEENSNTY